MKKEMLEVDLKALFDEIKARHPQEPNSNEIHGFTFDLNLLYHCFLQNSKGEIFELWEHKEVEKDDERYALIYAYKIIPQYQGGYDLKPVMWRFGSLNEAINALGKMRLFYQLENAKDWVHRFESEIYKHFARRENAIKDLKQIKVAEFVDENELEMPF